MRSRSSAVLGTAVLHGPRIRPYHHEDEGSSSAPAKAANLLAVPDMMEKNSKARSAERLDRKGAAEGMIGLILPKTIFR